MKILITGAGGFIGSHITEKLVKEGHDVKAMVEYNSLNSWGWLEQCDPDIKGHFEVFMGDIRYSDSVEKAVNKTKVIIHLAALIGIPYSYISPQSYIDTNVKGTHNLLQSAINNDIDKFIHTSTSEVYGTAKKIPINENSALDGQSPYAASKISADQLVNSYYKSFQLPTLTIRPFNTYGPRQSNRAILPTLITQFLSNKKNIKIGNLNPTRDFNYIDDTVDGFLKALKVSKNFGETINIGSGDEISIKNLIKVIEEIFKKKMKIDYDKKRFRPTKSEVPRLCADNLKAKKLLNWKPKYKGKEGFKKGLKKTIAWFSEKKNLDFYKTNIYNF